MGHYEIFRQCKVLGYKKVLILEDDCRFLNDINEIETILSNIPDYDICLFDKFIPIDKTAYFNAIKNDKVNEYYFDFSNVKLWSTGCYALNEKAITHLISLQENCFLPADHSINKVNNYGRAIFNDDLLRISSITNIAVQEFEGKEYRTESDRLLDQQIYKGIVDRIKYNVKL